MTVTSPVARQLRQHREHQLSPQELRFVDALMLEPDPVKAAATAGFGSPDAECWRLLADMRIKRALYDRRQSLLESVIAIHGLRIMEEMIRDKSTPAATRALLLKMSMEASGHIGGRAKVISEESDSAVDLSKMTTEELQALSGLIGEAKAEVQARRGDAAPVRKEAIPIRIS